ncbi:MAG: DUF2306 domain-containing protein [Saprospiraceae bacterium]|nr:DUF2306 domain-containing protein [Saprospiraceae bacterium]
MNQSNTFTLSNAKSYLTLALWVFLIAFAGKFVIKDALPYFGFQEEIFGRFWSYKWSLIGHVSGGLLALAIGPFQFWKALRNKYLTMHRWLGRIYLTAILVGTISSTYLAWTSALAIHWTWALALQGLAFAWIITATMAYVAVRRKRIQQHREWMIRSYVVTFAFVLFRFLNELPALRALGNFVERGPTEIWISWTIPLLITEVLISWKKK